MSNKSFFSSSIQQSTDIEGIKFASFNHVLYDIRSLFFEHFDVDSAESFISSSKFTYPLAY